MKKCTTIILLILFISGSLLAQQGFNCFSIIVGKKCTMDGSVLFGHNEDDSGDMIVNMYKVPSLKHKSTENITFKNGALCPQIPKTNSYIWLEMPGMQFSDGYLNEYGVAFASDNCPSKEDNAEITDGGIGYWLRRLMAERSTTAREAVKIGGALIEKYGYIGSGRSYCIADPNEGWVMSVVNGKHWVAQRIPNDKVMIVPNYYVMEEINLSDTLNFLSSSDIIDYAVSRGWYNPQNDGNFNFRKVYGRDWSIAHPHNINRKWGALRLLSNKKYKLEDDFPFLINPDRKLDLEDIFAVLRDHYERTDLENIDRSKSIHSNDNRPICAMETQYGFVAQLRNNVPKELAGVLWYAPVQPCIHPFVPIYFSISNFPESFAHSDYATGLKLHFDTTYPELKKTFENHSFQSFTTFSNWVNEDYYNHSIEVIEHFKYYEKENIEKHYDFDQKLIEEFSKNPKKALRMLNKYSQENLNMLISIQHD